MENNGAPLLFVPLLVFTCALMVLAPTEKLALTLLAPDGNLLLTVCATGH